MQETERLFWTFRGLSQAWGIEPPCSKDISGWWKTAVEAMPIEAARIFYEKLPVTQERAMITMRNVLANRLQLQESS